MEKKASMHFALRLGVVALSLLIVFGFFACAEEKPEESNTEFVQQTDSVASESEFVPEPQTNSSAAEKAEESHAHIHTYGESVIENVWNASCTVDGSFDTVIYCSVCHAEIMRSTTNVPATGHISGKTVRMNEKAATCTEEGSFDTVVYCAVCNAEITTITTTIPATGHYPIIEKGIEATCIAEGKTDGSHCGVCGFLIKAQTVSPALGHNYVDRVCSRCGDTIASEGLSFSLNPDGESYSVMGIGTCKDSTVYIPKTHNGKIVTAIGESAFSNQKSILGVVIPNSVIKIGSGAFRYSGITEITIPESVTEIGTGLFYGTSIQTLYYNSPYKPSNSSENPFMNNSNIKKIIFGWKSVPYCAAEYFGFSNYVESVEINDSVIVIEENAFKNCKKLKEIIIGNGVTTIESGAFNDCDSFTEIVIPDSVTSIGQYAFYDCSELANVTLSSNLKIINDYSFYGCKIENIIIPTGVENIGNYAFYDNKNICVTLPKSVSQTGTQAFSSCKEVYYNGTLADWCNIERCNINSIVDDDDLLSFSWSYDLYITGTLITDVVLPDEVTNIEAMAFAGCASIESITIPDSVTRIPIGAFFTCNNLSSVTIGNGVVNIEEFAFLECNNLLSVTIGSGVVSIKEYAFEQCNRIKTVYYSGNIEGWCNIEFSNGYGSSPLRPGVALFIEGKLLTDAVIPKGVTSINTYAFYGCDFLMSVTIPDSVTSIGARAFYKCTNLKTVAIPNSVISIGASAFEDCTNLSSVTIGKSISNVKSSTFYGCKKIESVVILDGATSIGEYAFMNCTGITSIRIPSSVTRIEKYAFNGCQKYITFYFTGTEDQWRAIQKEYGFSISPGTVVYNSK